MMPDGLLGKEQVNSEHTRCSLWEYCLGDAILAMLMQ